VEQAESSMLKADDLTTYWLTDIRAHELISQSTNQRINQSTICEGI